MSAATLAAPTADALAREHPEFRGWLDLLAVVREEAGSATWADATPDLAATAPLLAGAILTIDPGLAAAWLRRLLDVAAASAPAVAGAAHRLDPLAALEAAIALDTPRIDTLADIAGLPASRCAPSCPSRRTPGSSAAARRSPGAPASSITLRPGVRSAARGRRWPRRGASRARGICAVDAAAATGAPSGCGARSVARTSTRGCAAS